MCKCKTILKSHYLMNFSENNDNIEHKTHIIDYNSP
ncbi:hypothetical protein CHRY9293_00575 [Chryseobacterium potabilaquae]|uniref:Uncharacterized protein n=1 Tax=Chryseobacterium potabilaquae TaxID=2675057 RepID=A0A6N4X4T1_9FLAO|nr:hypothetical protein CHRY9293_00575 [Chryseobacterium potabilaquae]